MDHANRISDTELRGSAGLLTGLLIGGLAGYGAMILFAPQSGKKTRAQMRETSDAMQDRAINTFDDLVALSHFDSRKILSGTREKNNT